MRWTLDAAKDWFNEYKDYLDAGANPLIMKNPGDPELFKLGLHVNNKALSFFEFCVSVCESHIFRMGQMKGAKNVNNHEHGTKFLETSPQIFIYFEI